MIINRRAVRAVILTPDREILLLRIRPPEGSKSFWITPGGGLEADETIEAGLRRELQEELGLDGFPIGPLVWRRQHTFDWAERRICQYEEYYVVQVPRFEPHMSDDLEMHVVDRFQWWPVAELARIPERLTPLSLAAIVCDYLSYGPPQKPLDLEVLID